MFSYKLDYESAGFYDGNIGKQYWQSANDQNQAVGLRSYTMTYDPLKRMTGANFAGLASENYSLSGLTYDKNGNIKTMQRNGKTSSGFGLMDNLNYAYDGNKLNQVTDGVSATDNEVDLVPRGSGNYTYYTDGSIKSDENEGISLIIYDTFLKQPKEVQLTDGRKINHYYDGAGALLKTVYSTGEYWEFGGIIYKNGQPFQMATPEGRAIYVNGAWQYEFFYNDHLGNTRVAFRANGNQLVKTSETAFDPWGVVLRGAGQVNGVTNRFEYQDKESEKTFGLNRINLGARTYNPTTGRMDRTDRFADKYFGLSTFQYSANNPIRFIDINGDSLFVQGDNGDDFRLTWSYTENRGYGLYNSKGELYQGNNKFVKSVSDALSRLNLSEEGKAYLAEAAAMKESVTISETNKNNVTQEGVVYVNPTLTGVNTPTQKGNVESPFYITLGHEIAHAYANVKGTQFSEWVKVPTSNGDRPISTSEIYATHMENIFRSSNALPLRTHYSPIAGGGALEETRIIDSQGASLFYKSGQTAPNQINLRGTKSNERYKY